MDEGSTKGAMRAGISPMKHSWLYFMSLLRKTCLLAVTIPSHHIAVCQSDQRWLAVSILSKDFVEPCSLTLPCYLLEFTLFAEFAWFFGFEIVYVESSTLLPQSPESWGDNHVPVYEIKSISGWNATQKERYLTTATCTLWMNHNTEESN